SRARQTISSGDSCGSLRFGSITPARCSGGRAMLNEVEPYFRFITKTVLSEMKGKGAKKRLQLSEILLCASLYPASLCQVFWDLYPGVSAIIGKTTPFSLWRCLEFCLASIVPDLVGSIFSDVGEFFADFPARCWRQEKCGDGADDGAGNEGNDCCCGI